MHWQSNKENKIIDLINKTEVLKPDFHSRLSPIADAIFR